MSPNIPLDIQIEIIKHLPAKSLIRFRSVSKQWKSVIHSSEFITSQHHNVNLHHLLIRYKVAPEEDKHVSIVDDDSFSQCMFYPILPLTVKPASYPLMLDCSHGLVCLFSFDRYGNMMIVVWNPSIRKSVGIMFPYHSEVIGFGVCPKTSDPKIVKITRDNWQADFTLSSRAWRSVFRNLPYKSLVFSYSQVVIDGVIIHWHTFDLATSNYRIISFDFTSEEFGELDLPDTLADYRSVFSRHIFWLNESLAVLNYREDDAGKRVCDVWKMLKNGVPQSSFTKLFTVMHKLEDGRIIGFQKNGQLMVEHLYRSSILRKELGVYDPFSGHTSGLGIYGYAFMMTFYTESLLLLNYTYTDSTIRS
ncbi:putative F-box protein At1g32420 [Bidens hawaiensis]|uniref:putative F-box protein At1g32420 n=1 Tax=Bidens hawaiensis TaxID=980011 RepID=UPI004049EF8F